MHVLVHLLHLPDMGMQTPVRGHKTVGAEIGIIRHTDVAHVPSVTGNVPAILILDGESLVHPVPDKSALKLVVLVYQVPVVLQVARTVTHRVGILAKNQRSRIPLVDMAAQSPYPRIHRTVDIRDSLVSASLILHRTGGITAFCPVIDGLEIRTIAGLVAERPYYYAGKIPVPLHHPRHTLDERSFPVRIACQSTVGMEGHAVGLEIGLVHKVETVLVAKVVPLVVIGIVRITHRIDIELLHQPDILQHAFHRDSTASLRTVFVAVHTLEQYRHSVDQHLPVPHLHRAETEGMGKCLQTLAPGI